MTQQEIEVILMRQMASYLVMPVFILDPQGALVFYNDAAAAVLGRPFEDGGDHRPDEWLALFSPTDGDGRPLRAEELPVSQALQARLPASGRFCIQGHDQVRREVDLTAFPILGIGDRHLGAVALVWEARD